MTTTSSAPATSTVNGTASIEATTVKAAKPAKVFAPSLGDYLTAERNKARGIMGQWCKQKGINLADIEAEYTFSKSGGKVTAMLDALDPNDEHDAAMKLASDLSRLLTRTLREATSFSERLATAKAKAVSRRKAATVGIRLR